MTVSVFVGQYTRQIAHELDDLRAAWQNRRENYAWLGTLPPDYQLILPTNLNHAEFLGDKENLNQHYADAVHDLQLIDSYLTHLRAMKTDRILRVHGQTVTIAEFEDHRNLLLRQREYVLNLSRRLRLQVKRHNIMHSQIREARVAEFAGVPVPEDIEIIRQLAKIIKQANRRNEPLRIDDDISFWLTRADAYLGHAVHEYLAESIELYPDDTIDPTSAPRVLVGAPCGELSPNRDGAHEPATD